MVKKVDDMAIAKYIEYEERMKRQYSRNSDSCFPTYFGHCTSNNNIPLEFPRNTYFNPIPPYTKFNYESEDMELDEEAGCTTDEESVTSEHDAIDLAHAVNTQSFEEELSSEEDLDEWLRAEMENNMSKQDEKNEEDALIAIIKSIREEYTINNDSFASNLPSLEELNPGSFLLPFTINNYNFYALANIDASNNVMPRSVYKYLKPANHRGATMEMIILGRPFLETIHAQIDVFQEEISSGICKDRIKFERFSENANRECLDSGAYDSDKEIVFNKWILDSFDVEEEYAKEIGNPYSQRFNEYKQMYNEVENLSN
nr:hypothetical protein [Tanacetum cinerariifolium]